MKIFPKAPL